MKNQKKIFAALTAIFFVMAMVASQTSLVFASTPAVASQSESAPLSQEEIDMLYFMREEEKVAQDVYLTLYEIWGQRTFLNIAKAETRHMDRVGELLDTFGIEDIITDPTVGVFVNEELQKLYDDLVERGSESLEEALLVGALIEEVDILDLEEGLEATENKDIETVYTALLKGSVNHLKAFTRIYERQADADYEPQVFSAEQLEDYLNK